MLWKIGLALLGIVVLTLVVMVFKLAKMDAKDEVSDIEKLSKKMTGSLCLFCLAGCIRRDDNKNHNKSRWN